MSRALSRSICALLLAAGCGRFDFDPSAGVGIDGGAPGADAGAPGADGGQDAVAPCHHASDVFCDGFESGDLSAWSAPSLGAVTLQRAQVHGGKVALQVMTGGSQASAVAKSQLHVSTGSIHGRAWFFVPSDFNLTKIDVLSLEGASQGVVFLVDQNKLVAYDEVASATITTGVAIPQDMWFCVELHVDIAMAPGGTVALDLGGQNLVSRPGLNTMPGPSGYTSFAIGIQSPVPGQGAGSFFIDDVVVGTQPIGCD